MRKLPEAYHTISETMQLIQDLQAELETMRTLVITYYQNYGGNLKIPENGSKQEKSTEHIVDLDYSKISYELTETHDFLITISDVYDNSNNFIKFKNKIKEMI